MTVVMYGEIQARDLRICNSSCRHVHCHRVGEVDKICGLGRNDGRLW